MKLFYVFFISIFWFGCDSNRHSGTSGATETTNGLSIELRDAKGNILANQTVYFLYADSWINQLVDSGSTIIESQKTDANGMVSIELLNAPSFDEIWIYSSNDTLGVRKLISTNLDKQKLMLEPMVSINLSAQMNLSDSSLLNQWFLNGLPFSLKTDSTSSFLLPKGDYKLIQNSMQKNSSPIDSNYYWGNLIELKIDTNLILPDFIEPNFIWIFEDFNDGNAWFKWANIFDGGYWWFSSSNQNKAGYEDEVSASTINDALMNSMDTLNNSISHVIHFDYKPLASSSQNWFNFGVDIPNTLALSKKLNQSDSLFIEAYGKGSWIVVFRSKEATCSSNFSLSETSTTQGIALNDFSCKTTPIKEINIESILFQTSDTASISLDQISFSPMHLGLIFE